MALFNCNCRSSCTGIGVVISIIIGVLAAFFQITGVISVSVEFLWVVFSIAVAYLAALQVAAALAGSTEQRVCRCSALNALLVGILGSVLLSLLLLAVGIVATSVISAILVGALLFFFALMLAGSACYVKCLDECGS